MSGRREYDSLDERVDVSNTEDVWDDGFWAGWDAAKVEYGEIMALGGN